MKFSPKNNFSKQLLCCLLFAVLLIAGASNTTLGQTDLEPGLGGGLLQSLEGISEESAPIQLETSITMDKSGTSGKLNITVIIDAGKHIYSLTQGKTASGSGPEATKILIDESTLLDFTGPFQSSKQPKKHIDKTGWKGLELQEHEKQITFSAPFRLRPAAAGKELDISGKIDTQACDEHSCVPINMVFFASGPKIAANLAIPKGPGTAVAQEVIGKYRGKSFAGPSNLEIQGNLSASKISPGGSTILMIKAVPNKGWHTYGLAAVDPAKPGNKPTLIPIQPLKGFKTSAPFTSSKLIAAEDGPSHYDGTVTWKIRVEAGKKIKPGKYTLQGYIGIQVCSTQCERPQGVAFSVPINILSPEMLDTSVSSTAPLTFGAVPYKDAAKLAIFIANGPPKKPAKKGEVKPILIPEPIFHQEEFHGIVRNAAKGIRDTSYDGSRTFSSLLALGFLGGIVLNVMPCVLPVIGLKLFAFMEQAGQSRGKVFALNLWYSLGVISIFMVLALLASVFKLGWGQLFQHDEFNISMAAIVFIMGLSFLGIWEIPIPGFIGTSKVTDIGEKEGYEGAFAKGTITTILATPCTGPFMGTAIAGLVTRPTHEIFAIFFAMGLGMASPYLIIGAFPGLIRFLPKPGEWMNTFKQIMGFMLIGTVIYLLTSLHSYLVLPTFALLFGLWFACWWIGRVPVTASADRRWRALGEGAMVAAVVGLFAMFFLAPVMKGRHEKDFEIRLAKEELKPRESGEYMVRNLPWQIYTEKKLQWLLDNNKTVVIDFTADWCPSCKTMEELTLETEATEKLLLELDVYSLRADWTHYGEAVEVQKKLEEYNQTSIPLLAIYPKNVDKPAASTP